MTVTHKLVAAVAMAAAFQVTLTASALAQQTEPMATDRPGFSEGADVVGRGRVQVETGLTFASNGTSRSLTAPNALVRVGFGPRFEVRLGGEGFLFESEDGVGRKGYSDLEASLKVRLLDEHDHGVDLAIVPLASLPTGADGFTSARVDPGIKVAASRSLPFGWQVGANALLQSVSDADGRFSQRAVSVSASRAAVAGWNGFVEIYAVTPPARQTRTDVTLDWGVTRPLGANAMVDVEAGHGVSHAGWFMGAGFSIRHHRGGRD